MNPNLLREPERWSERDGGTSAEDAIGGSFKRNTVKPAVDFSSLEEVLVVLTPTPAREAGQGAPE